MRINCVVPGWILTERAQRNSRRCRRGARAAPEPIPMDAVADAVMRLVADDALNHQVVVL